LRILIWGMLALLATIGSGCDDYFASTKRDVELRVTGSASSVSVTYQNASGGTSQGSGCGLPWSYTYTGWRRDFAYISAQNEGDHGTVTASIYVGGALWKSSTSSGAYVIATASGSLP
jgi:hypothetical protein